MKGPYFKSICVKFLLKFLPVIDSKRQMDRQIKRERQREGERERERERGRERGKEREKKNRNLPFRGYHII